MKGFSSAIVAVFILLGAGLWYGSLAKSADDVGSFEPVAEVADLAPIPPSASKAGAAGRPQIASKSDREHSSDSPTAVPSSQDSGHQDSAVDSPYLAWIAATSRRTGIPARALQAYAHATEQQQLSTPGCRLSWNTLAAVAAIESIHGTMDGRTINDDGTSSSPIIGPALVGGKFALIPDSDGGRLDGDPVNDHAIGPFQFLPSTWALYSSDGNGDGISDPNNIDDASLAAARYLCSDNADLSTGAGWSSAILSYNHSAAYLDSVLEEANRIADEVTKQDDTQGAAK